MKTPKGWSLAIAAVVALALFSASEAATTERAVDTPKDPELSSRTGGSTTGDRSAATPIYNTWSPTIQACGPDPCSIVLGDMFTGDVGITGTQTVVARFNATQGTLLDLKVTMRRHTPTVVLLDGMGNEVDLGNSLRSDAKKGHVRIRDFEIPWSGNFSFAIAGMPGGSGEGEHAWGNIWLGQDEGPDRPDDRSGTFRAETSGDPPTGVELVAIGGAVFNAISGEPVPNAMITMGPYVLYTDLYGRYRDRLPSGDYTAVYEAFGFMPAERMIAMIPAEPVMLDVALEPLDAVVVDVTVDGDAVPGGMLTATATYAIFDGSELVATAWEQTRGVPVVQAKTYTEVFQFQLGAREDYKYELIHVLKEPPIGEDQLPPNVELPPGDFPGGLQDRFQVVGLNPFSLEEAALVVLEFTVETTSGMHHAEVEIHTHLPWKVTTGLETVPVGIPVLLYGKDQATYDWSLTAPGNSSAMLIDPMSQVPEFVPDVRGLYELSVFDADMNMVTLDVYTDIWRGIIIGQDADGRPVADGACVGCHTAFGQDQFTPWAQSGHAEIFTDNLDTSTHYGPNCFSCHGVGYDPDVDNGGMDDASDYQAFLGSGLLNNPGDNWTQVLEEFPAMAMLANIQCENCHGPQGNGHGLGAPRVSMSSDSCATCHGEPLRHARFQQWQLSGHANYELAIDESQSGSCAKCHTGNGFVVWVNQMAEGVDPEESVPVTWTEDEAHPATCQACHDPHMIGTTTGNDNNATVRISGDTPMLLAGFQAFDVGRGAICMTCHNSRRGLRNDSTWPDFVGTSEAARAPHGPAQADVLMGENAYLVGAGNPGNHGMVEGTCATCHMEETPPPADLAYNFGGTNHTFYARNDICANCHDGGLTGDGLQGNVSGRLHELQDLIEAALHDVIADLVAAGNQVDVSGALLFATADDVAMIADLEFGETRGRHALTFTMMDDTVVGPIRVTDIDVIQPDPMGTVELYNLTPDNLIKAGWNYLLVHNDLSLGVHNPTYTFQVLGASKGAVMGLP